MAVISSESSPSRIWRNKGSLLKFKGYEYVACGHKSLQDRPYCPICGRPEAVSAQSSEAEETEGVFSAALFASAASEKK